ncbi:AbrB/MazE/SpoVT family DNA-binding domain-containing protein [Alicyclobacillus mengziensis]|uniref:AbrB family transcriptional regulator n=1 Tax=Alicyclobacillus mengziensis TaxID=2931921 RepID=A0A9X7VX09_9BACL|nr:AbrB/MazE/SpoVT family DNA-binding domain-containing protein [Alicyclobacillus mengziensis]QSO46631.1 AbrB family transcriptional regulator [Alicyclobacillus mengziensis]
MIPIELRRVLDIKESDSLEIFTDHERIILSKYQPACAFCGEASGTITYKSKKICTHCLVELSQVSTNLI